MNVITLLLIKYVILFGILIIIIITIIIIMILMLFIIIYIFIYSLYYITVYYFWGFVNYVKDMSTYMLHMYCPALLRAFFFIFEKSKKI